MAFREMTDHLLAAWKKDIEVRVNGRDDIALDSSSWSARSPNLRMVAAGSGRRALGVLA
jgi:hypothetical protein